MSGSYDLTQLIGFDFGGLEIDSTAIDPSSDPDGQYYVVTPDDFSSNYSDPGFGSQVNLYENVINATNGTSLDGTPLQNPAALGQLEVQDNYPLTGGQNPPVTFDVLGYSADGTSILVANNLQYYGGNTDPYAGNYYVFANRNIDPHTTPSGVPSVTQVFTATNTYTGGPTTAEGTASPSLGGTSTDLSSLTAIITGTTISPALQLIAVLPTGVTLNEDGTVKVTQTSVSIMYPAAKLTADTKANVFGSEGQSTLQINTASGVLDFQVAGWNSTQILFYETDGKGNQLENNFGQPNFDILSIANPPPVTTSGLDLNFGFFGTAPIAGVAYACFVSGTLISTPDGDRPVEALRVGDAVVTASGTKRPIIWVGSARVDTLRHADPERVKPILVMADAFGAGLPRRDLFLSPDHAVFVDDMLVPIKELLNGSTIRQVDRRQVTYFHIELESHDVVLAEGLPAESYLDCGYRGALQGLDLVGGGFIGDDANYVVWESLGYRPLTVSGKALDAVRARLVARAELIYPAVRFDLQSSPQRRSGAVDRRVRSSR